LNQISEDFALNSYIYVDNEMSDITPEHDQAGEYIIIFFHVKSEISYFALGSTAKLNVVDSSASQNRNHFDEKDSIKLRPNSLVAHIPTLVRGLVWSGSNYLLKLLSLKKSL